MPPVAASQRERVLRLAGADPVEVVAQAGVQRGDGAVAADHQLAEVADVEDAHGLAHRRVLLEHPGGLVLQRHLPAAELGELGAEGDVPVVQRRLRQGRAGGHGRQRSADPRELPI